MRAGPRPASTSSVQQGPWWRLTRCCSGHALLPRLLWQLYLYPKVIMRQHDLVVTLSAWRRHTRHATVGVFCPCTPHPDRAHAG